MAPLDNRLTTNNNNGNNNDKDRDNHYHNEKHAERWRYLFLRSKRFEQILKRQIERCQSSTLHDDDHTNYIDPTYGSANDIIASIRQVPSIDDPIGGYRRHGDDWDPMKHVYDEPSVYHACVQALHLYTMEEQYVVIVTTGTTTNDDDDDDDVAIPGAEGEEGEEVQQERRLVPSPPRRRLPTTMSKFTTIREENESWKTLLTSHQHWRYPILLREHIERFQYKYVETDDLYIDRDLQPLELVTNMIQLAKSSPSSSSLLTTGGSPIGHIDGALELACLKARQMYYQQRQQQEHFRRLREWPQLFCGYRRHPSQHRPSEDETRFILVHNPHRRQFVIQQWKQRVQREREVRRRRRRQREQREQQERQRQREQQLLQRAREEQEQQLQQQLQRVRDQHEREQQQQQRDAFEWQQQQQQQLQRTAFEWQQQQQQLLRAEFDRRRNNNNNINHNYMNNNNNNNNNNIGTNLDALNGWEDVRHPTDDSELQSLGENMKCVICLVNMKCCYGTCCGRISTCVGCSRTWYGTRRRRCVNCNQPVGHVLYARV